MAELSRLEKLFTEALKLSPGERPAFLTIACGDDAALRAEVERLLAAVPDAGAFLEAPTQLRPDPESTVKHVSEETAGRVIAGKYNLIEPIGEGGMGTVWIAHQTVPVRRQVAVKLIKAGMDSKSVLARFEAERQALALMDHPNIAKVLDGGLTDDHRPYFVMELVKGVPITEYCDQHHLTPQQRLELFIPVCQAIQHAHQKGIIHRDIKPSNVLIALYDDKPVPKVIDFGVAKATGQQLSEQTINTGFGGIVGTPQYMSPEQATFNNIDIDTRSDVYSLGVVLYELLAGSPPFKRKELEKAGYLEILRIVREEDPPKPSTKLSTADALPSLSANRGMEPKKLTGLLRSELDWIVMKALEKDRKRRYETANGFAADIHRYLAGEPVLAHPPSAGYRLKKLLRKHRGPAIAASLIAVTLIAGIVSTTLSMLATRDAWESESRRATSELKARQESDRHAAEEKQARLRADAMLVESRETNEILGSILLGLDPTRDRNNTATLPVVLSERLDEASRRLDRMEMHDPMVRTTLQYRIAKAYHALGFTKKALTLLETCHAEYIRLRGRDSLEALNSAGQLSEVHRDDGNSDRAKAILDENLALCVGKYGSQHETSIQLRNNLAYWHHSRNQFRQAIELHETNLVALEQESPRRDGEIAHTLGELASALRNSGQYAKAKPLFLRAEALAKTHFGENHIKTQTIISALATLHIKEGHHDRAIPLFESIYKFNLARFGADHPVSIADANNLGAACLFARDFQRAAEILEPVAGHAKKKLGLLHQDTMTILGNLGAAYLETGGVEKAITHWEDLLKAHVAIHGENHPDVFVMTQNLASAYWRIQRFDVSVPMFERVLAAMTKANGVVHPDTIHIGVNLVANYLYAGRYAEALTATEEWLPRCRDTLGDKHPTTNLAIGNALSVYQELGLIDRTIPLLQLRLNLIRKAVPAGDPRLAGSLAQLGFALLMTGQPVHAEAALRESLAIREKRDPDSWTTQNVKSMLGESLLKQRKLNEAEPLIRDGYEGLKKNSDKLPANAAMRLPEAIDRLALLSFAKKNSDEARQWLVDRAKYPHECAPVPRSLKR